MQSKDLKASSDLRVPFIPIVAAWLGVKFVREVALLEKRDKSANRGQERFLLACGDVEVGRLSWAGGFDQDERIALQARFASRGTEGGAEAYALAPSSYIKAAARYIDGRTDGARKGKEVRTREGQFHGRIAAHRNTHDGALLPAARDGKAGLGVGDQVADEVVFVFVFGVESGIHVIRAGAINHDKNQATSGIGAHVGVVGPIAEAGAAAVQQVRRRQFRACGNFPRQIDAVRHVALKGGRVEGYVLAQDPGEAARMVHKRRLTAMTARKRGERGDADAA